MNIRFRWGGRRHIPKSKLRNTQNTNNSCRHILQVFRVYRKSYECEQSRPAVFTIKQFDDAIRISSRWSRNHPRRHDQSSNVTTIGVHKRNLSGKGNPSSGV